MIEIPIPESDNISFKELTAGNSIQIRVNVQENEKEYKKGEKVRVIYQDQETVAKIVSDPIVIDNARDMIKMLSLILQKP